MSRSATRVREKFFADFAATNTGTTHYAPELGGSNFLPELFLTQETEAQPETWTEPVYPNQAWDIFSLFSLPAA